MEPQLVRLKELTYQDMERLGDSRDPVMEHAMTVRFCSWSQGRVLCAVLKADNLTIGHTEISEHWVAVVVIETTMGHPDGAFVGRIQFIPLNGDEIGPVATPPTVGWLLNHAPDMLKTAPTCSG